MIVPDVGFVFLLLCADWLEFAAFDVVFEGQFLPTWEPLTPPMSDGDEDPILYHNPLLDGLYETELMDEMRLPQHIFDLPRPLTKYSHSPVKKVQEHRPSISLSTGNLYTGAPTGADNNSAVMQLLGSAAASMAAQAGGMAAADRDRAYALAGGASGSNAAPTDVDQLLLERMMSIESPSSPSVRRQSTSKKAQRSLFEGQHRQKGAARVMTPPPAEREAKDYEGPPWTIGEDYALLKAVMNEQRLTHHGPLRASLASAATIPDKDLFKAIKVNWEYVAGFVNKVTGVYRSPRQCSVHYQMVVLPRESGMTIALDIFTNKPKKLQPTQSELVHMRQGRTTTQLQYEADNAKILREKELEMLSVKRRIRDKRHPPFKRRAPLAPEATTAGIPSVHRMKINALEFGIPEADRPRQYILWREERRKQYPLHPDRQDSSRDPRKHDSLGSLVEDKPIPAPVRVRPTPCPHMEGPSLPFPEALMIEMPPAPAPLVLPAPALPAPALPPATQRGPVPPASAGVLGMPPSSAPHPISDHLPISRRAPPGTTHIIMGSGSQTGSSSGAGPSGSSGGSGGGGGGGFSGSSQSQYVVVANAEGGGTRMQVVRGEGSSGNSAIYRPNPGTKRAASGQPINRMEYSSGSAGMGGTPPPGSVLVRGPPARGGLGGQRVARPVNMSGGGQRIFMNTMSTGSGASSPSGAGGEGATSAGGSGQTQRYMVAAGTGGPLRVGVAPGSTLGPGRMQAAKRPPGGTLSKTMMLPGRPPGPMQQVRPINRFTGAPSSGGGGPGQHSRVMVMPGGRQYQPPGPQSSVSAGGSGVAGPLPPTLHHSASQPPQATISRPLMTGARTASFARASPSRGPGTPSGGGGIQRRASSSVLPRPARTVPRAPSGLSPDDPAKNQNAGGGEGEGPSNSSPLAMGGVAFTIGGSHSGTPSPAALPPPSSLLPGGHADSPHPVESSSAGSLLPPLSGPNAPPPS